MEVQWNVRAHPLRIMLAMGMDQRLRVSCRPQPATTCRTSKWIGRKASSNIVRTTLNLGAGPLALARCAATTAPLSSALDAYWAWRRRRPQPTSEGFKKVYPVAACVGVGGVPLRPLG
eukprot:68396-Amphidinium_carterae.1